MLYEVITKKAWDYQLELFNQLLDNKKNEKPNKEHQLLFCQHPHVFTIGHNGDDNNLLTLYLYVKPFIILFLCS